MEFDLPNEPIAVFTGNGTLNGGQQVLEHLALQAADGIGTYKVYFDNFEVVTTAALPGTVSMKADSTLTFDASATDPNSDPLTFGLELGAPADASINSGTGIFSWRPVGYAGTTNEITVYVEDSPAGGTQIKRDSQTMSVVVEADSLAPQSSAAGTFIAGGESQTITWDTRLGKNYKVQFKEALATPWSDLETISATGETASLVIINDGHDRYYRIVEVSDVLDE